MTRPAPLHPHQHLGGELLTLSISHKTASLALREKLALTETGAREIVQDLVERASVHEAVAISTCNRTEIYLVAGDPLEAETELLGTLARRAGMRPTELAGIVTAPRNCDAARQLFRVVSGLESMIVGEAEVQGQVKRAYEAARAAGTTGPLTNRLFTAALQTGKRVRTETEIGKGRASVSSAAVDLAEDVVGDLAEREVVLIGAGETSELTARALADHGAQTIFVANRRAERARAMAERVGGTVVSLDSLPARLLAADVVVSSTSSPHPLLTEDAVEEVMEMRQGRPLALIDIAVPRDIEPSCARIPGVSLFDMDDLQRVVERGIGVREAERSRAEAIVEAEIQRFAQWMGQLDVRPTVADLRRHGDAVVAQVLEENDPRWEGLSDRDRERVEAVARSVMQRLLHEPTLRLKALAGEAEGGGAMHGRLQVVRDLFGLDVTPGDEVLDAPASDNVRPLPQRAASASAS